MGEQHRVLAAGRLALRAVGDHDRRGAGGSATARSFRALETCAPPRPRRPLCSIASSSRGARVAPGRRPAGRGRAGAGRGSASPPSSIPRRSRGRPRAAAHHVISCAAAVPTTAPPASILSARRSCTGRAPGEVSRATTRSPRSADHPAAVEVRPPARAEARRCSRPSRRPPPGSGRPKRRRSRLQRRAGDADPGRDVDLRAPVARGADLPARCRPARRRTGSATVARSADGARRPPAMRAAASSVGGRAGAARPARLQRALQREDDGARDRGGATSAEAAEPQPRPRRPVAQQARRERGDDAGRRTRRSAPAATPSARRCRCPGRAARRPASTGTRPSAPPARRAGPGARAARWSRSGRRAGRRPARRSRATAGGSATRGGRPRRARAGARRGRAAR